MRCSCGPSGSQLPSDGKVPLVKNFQRWHGPPSIEATERLVRWFPDANVAILPGPSRVFVADVDTADQIDEAQSLLGPTPLQIATSRGRHFYYRHVNGCSDLPASLKKKLGLNVDLKSGSSIVIAPPSKHQSGATYEHVNCDWRDLERIPPPNLERLHSLLKPKSDHPVKADMRDGSRKQWLNDRLCVHITSCDTFSDLLDVARTRNLEIPGQFLGFKPLPDEVVIQRAQTLWCQKQDGRFEDWIGHEAVARARKGELNRLLAAGRNGSDAFALLMMLRFSHGARCRRKETFVLVTEAMARKQTMKGWHWKRYAHAIRILLASGDLILVSKGRGTVPAQYRLGGS